MTRTAVVLFTREALGLVALAPLSAKDIDDPTPGQRPELGYVDPIDVEVPAR